MQNVLENKKTFKIMSPLNNLVKVEIHFYLAHSPKLTF